VSSGAAEAVKQLKTKPGKDICLFGGGILFRSLLDAGLVDTIELSARAHYAEPRHSVDS